MLKTALALTLVGLAQGCSTDLDTERPWVASLSSLPCAEEVRSTLLAWGAGNDMLTAPPAPGSRARYRLPTEDLATWLLLEMSGSGATVSLVTPDRITTRVFESDCEASTTEGPNPLAGVGEERFTDADLRRAVEAASAEGTGGVIVYVWSPHMSLSVDGYSEIAAAAEEHGLGLVPVLFPGSDWDFAAAEAQRAGIPADGLREAASVELTFRDAQVHAPSILVFDGVRVSAVLPGYRSAEGYREFLEEFIPPS